MFVYLCNMVCVCMCVLYVLCECVCMTQPLYCMSGGDSELSSKRGLLMQGPS